MVKELAPIVCIKLKLRSICSADELKEPETKYRKLYDIVSFICMVNLVKQAKNALNHFLQIFVELLIRI